MNHLKSLKRGMTMTGMVFAFAALLVGLTPGKALAATVVTTGDQILGQFPQGDVARYKINVEKGTSGSENNKMRLTATIWCDNSAGAPVDCGAILGLDVESRLWKQVSGGSEVVVQWRTDYLDAANVHAKQFVHTWDCEGTTLGKYRASMDNMFVYSRFGEAMSAPKNRSTVQSSFTGSC